MTSFRCSLTRFFNLKGMDRYLYAEISARLNRDKIRTLIIDDELEAELEENLGGEIDLSVLRLHEAGIISRVINEEGEYVITPLVEPELVHKKPVVSKKSEDDISDESEGDGWESLAMSLIRGAGQTPSDNYTSSVVKELKVLDIPIDKAKKLLNSVNKTQIISVGGWVRTCGKSLIENIFKLDNHPMYKKYNFPEPEGEPASKSQIKKALEKMKEIVKCQQEPSDR